MHSRRGHAAFLVLTAVALISLSGPGSANIADKERGRGRSRTDSPASLPSEFLSLEQSRLELARAASAEETAWILSAAVTGLVEKDCELEIQLVPNGNPDQFDVNLTMSLREGREDESLRSVLEEALAGLISLGFRSYCMKQVRGDLKLSFGATLVKAPGRR